MGDFNAGEDNPVITYLKGQHADRSPAPVVDSFRLIHPDEKAIGTSSGFIGNTDEIKRDYIFVPPGTEVLKAVRTRASACSSTTEIKRFHITW